MDVPIPENADCRSIAETFFNLSSQTLKTTYNNLDFNAIKRAARCLQRQTWSISTGGGNP